MIIRKSSDLKNRRLSQMLERGIPPISRETVEDSRGKIDPFGKEYETARSYVLAKSARYYLVFNN